MDASLYSQVTGTTANVTDLSASTAYDFYVLAKDAAGNASAASSTLNVTTNAAADTEAPTAPTNLVASNVTETTVDLIWTASTDNVGVTEYEVYKDAVLYSTVAGTTANVTGLIASTAYDFYVLAKDAAGNASAGSATVNVTTNATADTEAPTAPTNLAASNVTETTVDLSWTASTDNVGVTEYEVYKDAALYSTVAGTTANVTDLTASTAYDFYVIAKDAAGNASAASSIVNVTTSEVLNIDYTHLVDGESLILYPNPVNQGQDIAVIIPQSMFNKSVNIKVIDISGREIIQGMHFNQANFNISSSILKKGLYLLHINSGGNQIVEQLLIN